MNKIIEVFIVIMLLIGAIVLPVSARISLFEDNFLNDKSETLLSDNTELKWMIAGDALRALRSYWLHVPPSYDESEAVPLVLFFHGNFYYSWDDPFFFFRECFCENYTKLSKKADEEGFILVYPNSKCLYYDPLQTRIYGTHNEYTYDFGWIPSIGKFYVDDIGFTSDLIDKMEKEYNINSSRIFITGHSAGAFMTYTIGAYLSDEVAAIAPVAGTIGGRVYETDPFSYIPDPENPVPAIVFHGTSDRNVPYEGNKNLVSVSESVSFWVENNGCNPISEINISESGKINRTTYRNGENGAEVVLYTIIRGIHDWPGSPRYPNCEIDATDLIWEFFEAHPK